MARIRYSIHVTLHVLRTYHQYRVLVMRFLFTTTYDTPYIVGLLKQNCKLQNAPEHGKILLAVNK